MLQTSPARIILAGSGASTVFNPAAIEREGSTHLLYRSVDASGISTIGKALVQDGKVTHYRSEPVIFPERDYERRGTEDPRVVAIEGKYYLTYTAYDGLNARIAYATSDDLETFTKGGILSPALPYERMRGYFSGMSSESAYLQQVDRYQSDRGPDVLLWHKDGFFFPKKIGGRFALIHRVLPGIQVAYFDDFTQIGPAYWEAQFEHFSQTVVLEPTFAYENAYIGGGCPPIETEDGWLLVYHAVENTDHGLVYHAALALLDRYDPVKVIARLPYPLFSPTEVWEREGHVKSVVFPSGAVVEEGRVQVYYGAADTHVARRSFDLHQALAELQRYR